MPNKDDNDNLEPDEAIPEAIPHETSREMVAGVKTEDGPYPDGDPIGEADTDRFDLTSSGGELLVREKTPTSIRFDLKSIRSLNAKCFFCKEEDCDLVFMAKSALPEKTRAYAVHTNCVFDHELLQDIGSQGGI
jgi:hypothetical protein